MVLAEPQYVFDARHGDRRVLSWELYSWCLLSPSTCSMLGTATEGFCHGSYIHSIV
jgi:hypothetical protein